MSKSRRTFSVEQKLQIIQEADQLGVTQVLRTLGPFTQCLPALETGILSGWSWASEAPVPQGRSRTAHAAGREHTVEEDRG
jgi:hypothetical protein